MPTEKDVCWQTHTFKVFAFALALRMVMVVIQTKILANNNLVCWLAERQHRHLDDEDDDDDDDDDIADIDGFPHAVGGWSSHWCC